MGDAVGAEPVKCRSCGVDPQEFEELELDFRKLWEKAEQAQYASVHEPHHRPQAIRELFLVVEELRKKFEAATPEH